MSLRGDKYETPEEVRTRLESSVVLYDGSPVYITKVHAPEDVEELKAKEVARVYFRSLPYGKDRNDTRKFLSSKKFDLSPFRMGYMNYNGEAIFVSRGPVRQYKQGLCAGNTLFTNCQGKRTNDVDFTGMIKSQGFVDMVNGKYPSFEEAGELVGNEETSSVAMSRSFAFLLDHDIAALGLFHKGVRCGIALEGDKGIRVSKKYHFLREEMEEHRIPLI